MARLPTSMALLAFQLAGLHAVGSLAKGAQLAGVSSLAAGAAGPWRGGWLDRREMRSGLQVSCFAAGVVMASLTGAVAMRASFPVLLVLVTALGAAVGGVWGGFRALLLPSVPASLLRQAHFAESLSTEIGYGLGPLVVTGVALVFGVVTALALMSVIFFGAVLALKWVPELPPTAVPRQRVPRPSRSILVICGVGALLSLGFGMVEGNVPARMTEYGLRPDQAGVFLVLLAIGSVIGGAVVSLRPIQSKRPVLIASGLFALFGLLIVPSTLAPRAWMFGVCLLIVSLMLVPLNGLGAAEIETRLSGAGRGRVFALYLATVQIGGGVGVTLNGVLLSYVNASRVPLVAAALYTMIAAVLLVASLRESRHRRPIVVNADVETSVAPVR